MLPNWFHHFRIEPVFTLVFQADVNVETFYMACLAQASYLVSHNGNAFLIDPRRDVDVYLDRIKYVLFFVHRGAHECSPGHRKSN